MEQDKIEEKLKIEKQILEMRREYKLISYQVDEKKQEFNTILDTIDKNKAILIEQKELLTEVLNDISSARLSWAIEKDEEKQKIADKLNEVNKILEKEKELDEKKSEVQEILNKNIKILNETRTLELKLDDDKNLIKSDMRAIKDEKKDLEAKKTEIETLKKDFQEDINSLINKYGRNN